MKKLNHSYWPAIFWSAIIIILLSIPGSDLPNETNFMNIPHADKWVHMALFALLVILWCGIVRYKNPVARLTLPFTIITIAAIVFGYLMELVQKFWVANRDYDMWDVAADSVGAVAGLIFSLIVYKKNRPL
ncbi:VanZ family protein [Niabella insulamsoli]|uniref:VanZ family protein n=1 Tax=Niabella insulamsoli TaxID=3144874 RepID=UPI0031FDCF13